MAENYGKLLVPQLKALLEAKGLSMKGNKSSLLHRLRQSESRDSTELSNASDTAIDDGVLISKESLKAARGDVFNVILSFLGSESDNLSLSSLDEAAGHPDWSIVKHLLSIIRDIMEDLPAFESPSMMSTLEFAKRRLLMQLTLPDVYFESTFALFEIFGISVKLQTTPGPRHDHANFESVYILPVKEALLDWLAEKVRDTELSGPATKFPEHFNTTDIAKLRKWAKAYISENNIDPEQLKDEHCELALLDEALPVDKAKSLSLVPSILRQSCAVIRRNLRTLAKRENDRKAKQSTEDTNEMAEAGEKVTSKKGRRGERKGKAVANGRGKAKLNEKVLSEEEEEEDYAEYSPDDDCIPQAESSSRASKRKRIDK